MITRLSYAWTFGLVWLLASTASLEVPTAPFLDLTVLSDSSVYANFSAPISDGGSAINSYKVEWDTDPGVQEVQAITTSTYTGPNEIQSITTSAASINEIQVVKVSAPAVQEVQIITINSATGGYYFVELNTIATGGSLQYSGYIYFDYEADDSNGNTFGKNVAGIISAV
eukprot:gene21111-23955_t